ncbi:MAG: YgaP family membrane protein [Thermodesulfobacteriota bacterium]
MTVDKLVFRFAGIFILISLLLYMVHSSYWLLLTLFVGANMVQATFSGFCPLAKILKFFGAKPGRIFD